MLDSALIQKRLDDLVTSKGAPGFQLALGIKDRCLGVFVAGARDPRTQRAVLPETWFDLASLTKIIATSTLTMMAVQDGRIRSLEDPVGQYFPSFNSALKDKSISDLLHHRAGLPPIFEWVENLPTREERRLKFLAENLRNFISDQPSGID
jgi:CubicO group peptidase (beta-lactamase class C family)